MLRKYRILIAFLFFVPLALQAQKRPKPQNLRNFDRKKIHFGFSLGINTMDFRMDHDLRLADTTLLGIETERQSGFNIGIVSAYHFNKNLSLRFLPGLAFGQRNINYEFGGDEAIPVIVKQVESTLIDIPLNFKFRSNRYNNFAAYVLVGAKYSIDLASEKDTDNNVAELDQLVRLQRDSYSWEVGVGLDFFLEYFKFSPEIKMSTGINNVLIEESTLWSNPLNRVQPRMFSITLNFEG